jgi:hypothetical protein
MKKSIFVKVVAIIFVLVIGYHFSGAEAMFCKDAQTSVVAHDCSVCHHNIHVATSQPSFSIPISIPGSTFSLQHDSFHPQPPALTLFRPPISL